jgi:hypothetical protein
MHDSGIGPHKTQFRRDENYGILISQFILQPKYAIYVGRFA